MLVEPEHAPVMHPGSIPSVKLSQSSSRPLAQFPAGVLSTGGVQTPAQAQPPVHDSVPVVPQLVVQDRVVPAQQANPLSQPETQSSSRPLQVSAGATQDPRTQAALQVREPVEPQLVVQLADVPAQHANPSSQSELQLSSIPLHTSEGGEQPLHAHVPLQVRVPVVPQLLVHEPVLPAQQANP